MSLVRFAMGRYSIGKLFGMRGSDGLGLYILEL
jgi:hypothetical protein